MKKTIRSSYFLLLAFVLFTLSLSITSSAQKIMLGPITKLSYCVGDAMSVPYTSTGGFGGDNSFVVQLSDANGSFSQFTDEGTMPADNASFWVTLNSVGSHYRVRIISTDPVVFSADNGNDITVNSIPAPSPLAVKDAGHYTTSECDCYWGAGIVGANIVLRDHPEASGSIFSWSFDQDASIPSSSSSSPIVSYSTPGIKTGTLSVTAPAGCSGGPASFGYQIFSCTPSIPANARIVTDAESGNDSVVWVQAGGTYTLTGIVGQSIFVEPGGAVIDVQSPTGFAFPVLYVKTGSSFTFGGENFATIITSPDNTANLPSASGGSVDIFTCPDFAFDYSQLPLDERPQQTASVSSAPENGIHILTMPDLFIATASASELSVTLYSSIGAELYSEHGVGTVQVDLHAYPAGPYIAVAQSGGKQRVQFLTIIH